MNLLPRLLLAASAVPALLASAAASADGACIPAHKPIGDPLVCLAPDYTVSFARVSKAGDCPPEDGSIGDGLYCVEHDAPPKPASVRCDKFGSSATCEAFPQGDGLAYAWVGTAVNFVPGLAPGNQFQIATCSNGRLPQRDVTVVVTGPNGLSSISAPVTIDCSFE